MSISQSRSAITFLLFTYSQRRNKNHKKEQRIIANKTKTTFENETYNMSYEESFLCFKFK